MAISPMFTKAVIRLPARRLSTVAPAMIMANPAAAKGVRTGAIPVATGAINPIDPATSATPISRNRRP